MEHQMNNYYGYWNVGQGNVMSPSEIIRGANALISNLSPYLAQPISPVLKNSIQGGINQLNQLVMQAQQAPGMPGAAAPLQLIQQAQRTFLGVKQLQSKVQGAAPQPPAQPGQLPPSPKKAVAPPAAPAPGQPIQQKKQRLKRQPGAPQPPAQPPAPKQAPPPRPQPGQAPAPAPAPPPAPAQKKAKKQVKAVVPYPWKKKAPPYPWKKKRFPVVAPPSVGPNIRINPYAYGRYQAPPQYVFGYDFMNYGVSGSDDFPCRGIEDCECAG